MSCSFLKTCLRPHYRLLSTQFIQSLHVPAVQGKSDLTFLSGSANPCSFGSFRAASGAVGLKDACFRCYSGMAEAQPSYDYDLVTIGAGSGGTRASRIAASSYNAKVACIEKTFGFVPDDHTGGAGGTYVPEHASPGSFFGVGRSLILRLSLCSLTVA